MGSATPASNRASKPGLLSILWTFGVGLAATVLCIVAEWGVVRGVYGDRFAGYAGKHIRFGPEATATTQKISPSSPHP
jgi:hypothetical protein